MELALMMLVSPARATSSLATQPAPKGETTWYQPVWMFCPVIESTKDCGTLPSDGKLMLGPLRMFRLSASTMAVWRW